MKYMLAFLLFLTIGVRAQSNLDYIQDKPIGIPLFDLNSFTYYNDQNEAVVNTLVRIENKALQYIQNNSKYESSFEITFIVTGTDGTVIRNEAKKDGHSIKSFESTQSSDVFHMYTFQNILPGGDYTLKVDIRDLNTNKSFSKTNKVTIVSFDKQALVLSDVAIIETVTDTSKKLQIVPLVDDIVNNADKGFSIYFELYPQNLKFPAIRFDIFLEKQRGSESDQPILLGTIDYKLDKRVKQQIFHKFDSKIIPSGDYSLIVKGKTSYDSLLAVKSKNYTFGWVNTPTAEKDLELAIEQLNYFAKTEVRDAMLNAESVEEKRKLFYEFWEKWDPTPGTPMNEMMNEYYNRVRIANKLFRAFKSDGWKTDRGMVYVMFGQPDYSESKLSSADTKPYEIWYYYDIHKKYYFMDYTGYGDYRLMNSLTGESSELR